MNDNGYLPANPQPIAITAQGDVFSTDYAFAGMSGLTKRERFALSAMQGLCSAHDQNGTWSHDARDVALTAVMYADALLAELELTPK